MVRDFFSWFFKWTNVFLWVGIGILIWAVFATANGGAPGSGVLGNIFGAIGAVIIGMLREIVLPVIDFIGDTIRGAPRP